MVKTDLADGLPTITFNRSDAKNAINGEISRLFEQTLRAAASNPEVRAILLRGAGRSFCAGGDVKMMAEQGQAAQAPSPARLVLDTQHGAEVFYQMLNVP